MAPVETSRLRRIAKLRIPIHWRRPLCWAYFCSGPILYALGMYTVTAENPLGRVAVVYTFAYSVLFLPIILIRGWLKGWRGVVTSVLGLALWLGFLEKVTHPIYAAGFGRFAYATFVRDDCHPINFVQDGKTYAFGLCDIEIDPDGQGDFYLAYDTSGDLRNDEDARAKNHTKDRKELVDVVRKIINDDPNFIFEIADFHTTKFCRNLYQIDFEDQDAWGFSKEYGPPPYNKKNKYRIEF